MTKLDEVVSSKGKGSEPTRSSADTELDKILEEETRELARNVRTTRLEEILTERQKRVELNKRDLDMIRSSKDPLTAQVAVTPGAQSALIKAMIESGTDPDKANNFIKALDQETLARIMLMSGTTAGAGSLLPLFLLARQPTSSIGELVDATSKLTEMTANKAPKEGFTEYAASLAALKDVLGGGSDKSLQDAYLARLDNIRADMQAQREAIHERELAFQKEIASMREERLSDQIGSIQQQLDELRTKDLGVEVKKAKTLMEDLGFKIMTGAEEKGIDVEKLVETVSKSPAVENLTSALGDRIRSGPGIGGRPRGAGAAPQGQGILCEVCKSRGVMTWLQPTPEILRGEKPLVCNVCGSVFEKG